MIHTDTVVLIPLHRSGRFLEVVEGNIARLAAETRVVISDVTEEDGTLATLASRWKHHPHVELRGKRPLAAGWVAHYNDLLANSFEPYFMWLAHDDEIEPEYVRRCREELMRDSSLTGAFGRLISIEESNLEQIESLDPPWPRVGGNPAAAVAAARDWNPGVAFRSLFRRSAVGIISPLSHEHWWADLVWVFALMSTGQFLHVPEVAYRKRWYSTSTHREWPADTRAQILAPMLAAELAWCAGRFDIRGELADVVEWASVQARQQLDDIEQLKKACDFTNAHLSELATEVDRLSRERAGLALERDQARSELMRIRASRSWRLTRRLARWAAWIPRRPRS